MYTCKNYRTKKEVIQAVANGEEVKVFQPGPFGNEEATTTGRVFLEGPHFPAPHRWYAVAVVEDSVIVKIR